MALASPALEAWFNQYEPGAAFSLGGTMVQPWSGPALTAFLPPAWGPERFEYGYVPTPGSLSTRQLVASELGLVPEGLLLTTGASEANHTVLRALGEPGTRVVLQDPLYHQFEGLALQGGATLSRWSMPADPALPPDMAALEAVLDATTRLVVLNTPHNPTGRVLSWEVLTEVARRVHAWPDAYLLVDEIYRGLGDPPLPTALSLGPRVLVTDALSKRWSLPGLRLGWVAGRPEAIERLLPYHEYATTCVSRLSEQVLEALWPRREALFAHNARLVRRNRAIFAAWLATMGDLLRGSLPQVGVMGLFWPRATRSDRELARVLRAELGLFCLPGSTLGYPGALRLGFGHRDEGDLVAALACLERGLRGLA